MNHKYGTTFGFGDASRFIMDEAFTTGTPADEATAWSRTAFVRKFILPHANADTLLRDLDKVHVLAYRLGEEAYCKPGELALSVEVLTPEEVEAARVDHNHLVLGFCLVEPVQVGSGKLGRIELFEVTTTGHNFGALLFERTSAALGMNLFPAQPLSIKYWLRLQDHVGATFQDIYIDASEDETWEGFTAFCRKLRWSDMDLSEYVLSNEV
ncbi:hypothetical protein WJX72_010781 [[Myrmecia] bisecta]|uniref:Uncharacterized protein n=1 Tax=[Myrmecia] bisecta TaxID=41462 RepID=A0AAW1PGM2_9CHLO